MRGFYSLAASLIVAALATSAVHAETATVGPVVISVPEGFERQQTQRKDGMQVTAWTKSPLGKNGKTLLQVSVYDFGAQLDQASPKDLANGSEKYLREFLNGIERRRYNFELSPVEPVKLAGLSASRATWKGNSADVTLVGVMYCVIVRKRYVVSFHTQDLGTARTAAMREAMKSIEAIQLSSTD